MTTPTTTARIRWEDKNGEALGYPGTFDRPAFRLWPPDEEGDRVLLVYLAGDRSHAYHDDTEDAENALKVQAERLLEEFVSSLGAVFPAALRAEIEQERTHHDLAAAEFAERGNVMEEARRYARVNALDWVLATIDRMEAGQ